jgi:hypothetical protein
MLEVNYGFLFLANGRPMGYGGFTPLFRQANTGVNIFPDFRGAEAAFVFQQYLRMIHTIAGCTRFIINPYQLGDGNDEALAAARTGSTTGSGFARLDQQARSRCGDSHRQCAV